MPAGRDRTEVVDVGQRLSNPIPPELTIENVVEDADTLVVRAKASVPRRACPRCGAASGRIHSRYVRTVLYLPCSGRKVAYKSRKLPPLGDAVTPSYC